MEKYRINSISISLLICWAGYPLIISISLRNSIVALSTNTGWDFTASQCVKIDGNSCFKPFHCLSDLPSILWEVPDRNSKWDFRLVMIFKRNTFSDQVVLHTCLGHHVKRISGAVLTFLHAAPWTMALSQGMRFIQQVLIEELSIQLAEPSEIGLVTGDPFFLM